MPGIHWLMVAGVLLIAAGGIATTYYILDEIRKNTAHNVVVLARSKQIETEARLIPELMLPAFRFLHSLDVAVTRHVAEFELHVLDIERDPRLLQESLSALEASFTGVPPDFQDLAAIDRAQIEEVVAVFADITYEALEVRSPNKLLQLLSDSEDVFLEFREQLDEARRLLDGAGKDLGQQITQDLRNARASVAIQQGMLHRLGSISIWSLSLLILFVLVTTVVLFRSLQRRLGAVARYAHAIADGEYSSTIDFVSPDRIGDMADSVSHMGGSMATLVEELAEKAEAEQRAARAARRLAYYDTLTGLPNRQHFIDTSEAAIAEAHCFDEKVAFVYMDLDDFKKVNDSFGHGIGDELLCAVADRLTHSVRAGDAIARSVGDPPVLLPSRLGGDEFTFLVNRLHDRGEAEMIARRILKALVKPYQFSERELAITPSMGVAVFPDDGDTVAQLMKHSDMAMYQAKENGRNNVKMYHSTMSERQVRKLGLERDLAKALEREELSVHYQAKVDLGSRQIVGAEALLRWHHPRHGMVSPMEFIPLAEETGMIVPIGGWVLQTACRQLIEWQSENIAVVPVSVNVSAKQFAGGELFAVARECVEMADICLGNIELELTESVLMQDTARTVEILNKLKEIGVNASLDDFGTGYSSLSYLKRFPLSTLKIDRSFVRDIETDADDASIVKAIIGLSASMGLKVIAEGVENEQQANFLSKHGCHEVQGYLFAKPMSAQEFTGLLTNGIAVSVA